MTDAAALHGAILTLDSHIDIPWPSSPDPFGPTGRHVDLPKMKAGGLDVGCFVAFVPQGPRTPAALAEAHDRAMAMLETIRGMQGARLGLTARVCSTADEIEAAHAAGALVVVPAIENGHAMGEDLGNLARFRAAGATYITISHNGHNLLADSANPRRDLGDQDTLHGGLSPLGREAIAEMNRLGLRDTEGLVQITAMPPFLKAKGRFETVGVADFCDHIDYVVRRIGLAHCGISSDFDGGGAITGWRDASESPAITAELVRRGYGHTEIAALWGGNFLRVMRAAEGKQSFFEKKDQKTFVD
jgi:membrane dipeptidase